jgi:hypothetical protein
MHNNLEMIKINAGVLINSCWNWQWLAAEQPLLKQKTLASLKSMALCPFPPAKVRKTSIRVNPLVHSLCSEYLLAV